MSVNYQILATIMQAAQTLWEVLSALVWMASLEMADSIVQVSVKALSSGLIFYFCGCFDAVVGHKVLWN